MKTGRTGMEGEEEKRERVEVRRLCLAQGFFDRGAVGSERPFGGEAGVDEGCVV